MRAAKVPQGRTPERAARAVLLAGVVALASGCVAQSLHQTSVMGFEPRDDLARSPTIRVSIEQKTILGVVHDSAHVDLAYDELLRKCPRGDIVGVTSTHRTHLGFFSWRNEVILTGTCVDPVSVAVGDR